MNFGSLWILLLSFTKFGYSALTVSNDKNENEVKSKKLVDLTDSIILFIGSFLHCPQSCFGSVNKHFNQLFMNEFPLEKFMFLRFGSPLGLFEKNLRSRYIFLASKLNLALDETVPENVAGLLKMLKDRGEDRKTGLEFVTELFNKAENSFHGRAEEFRQWLNTPCRINADHKPQGPLFAYFMIAGDRYNHDKNLLARIMLYTGIDSAVYFMHLFETGSSMPYFNDVVIELARIDLDACLEISQHYRVNFRTSFWAAISKIYFNGAVLSRILELNIPVASVSAQRNSCIFEVDETLLSVEEKNQVWERNMQLLNNYIFANSSDYHDMFNFLNNWKFRPELVSEEQINACLSFPSDQYLLIQLARTIIRKQRLDYWFLVWK